MVAGVPAEFSDYDREAFEEVWQSLFTIYTQGLRGSGGNEFEIEHAETTKRQQRGDLARAVILDREACDVAPA